MIFRRWAGARLEWRRTVMGEIRPAVCRLRKGDEAGTPASLAECLKHDPDVDSLFKDPCFTALRARPAFRDLVKKYL